MPLAVKKSLKQSTAQIDALRARLLTLSGEAQAIENAADDAARPLTAAEMAKLQQISDDFDSVEAQIEVREKSQARADKLAAPQRRLVEPDDVEAQDEEEEVRSSGKFKVGDKVGTSKFTHGFNSIGEFAIAGMNTAMGRPDNRILNAPASFGSEGAAADGGFALPPDFRSDIMKFIQAETSLFGMTDQQITSSNGITVPLDNTTPWQTSGGVVAQWVGEGQTLTGVKPSLAQLETKVNKLAALVPLTDELLADVPAMTKWLNSKIPDKFTSSLNDAIVNGNGVMKPQGMLNAASKITAAAVTGQGAGTVVGKNISAMWTRLYGPLRKNAVWLINQDVEPQLQSLVIPGTTPAFPGYMPPGGYSASPFATLFGRPIFPVEACQSLGTEGDIILCDPTQYLTVIKAGGMRADVSIHLYFDADMTAFRFMMRVGGQSYWISPITRQNGGNTLSPIVTLNSTRT